MPIKTIPFDTSKYFKDKKSQAELLADAFASGHAGYIANALGIVARARGMTEVADAAGVTRMALYKGLTKNGDPKLSTFLNVLKAVGLELKVQKARA